MSVLRSSAPMNAAARGFCWNSTRRWFRFACVEHTGIDTPLSTQGPRPMKMPGFNATCAHNRSEWLPRYAALTPHCVPSCCSTVTFQVCTRGELISGSIVPKEPNATYGVSGPVTMGWGSPPTPLYGSSSKPVGSWMMERLPNGGAPALMLWYSPDMKSYPMEYDERTARRPSPRTSHATPPRGERFHHCLLRPVCPFGNPGSPG